MARRRYISVNDQYRQMINPAVSFVLLEGHDFQSVWCKDLPGCDCHCGFLHLVPPLTMLLQSEFLKDSEVNNLQQQMVGLDSEALEKLTVEVYVLLDHRSLAWAEKCQQLRETDKTAEWICQLLGFNNAGPSSH
jgi:hypothetical protein